jgi:hypothetical protein
MTISYVTPEEALKRIAVDDSGALDSFESLCDFMRAEVHARKHAPRAATISRVGRLLAPAITLDEGRLDAVCDALEREGDVVLNPGGVLYATPTRIVATEKSARVFSSVPSRALAKAMGREIVAKGASRTTVSDDRLTESLAKVSGVMISPELWAGLDRAPHADAAFLAKLDQRLEWQSLGAGSLERDGTLEWRTWQVTPEGARWRRQSEGRLWWARTRYGGHFRAWTASGTPGTSSFITLTADDADRARFALSRQVRAASILRVERTGKRAIIEVPGWLPRPEYRWLSLHADALADTKGARWETSTGSEDQITRVLAERLGLSVETT